MKILGYLVFCYCCSEKTLKKDVLKFPLWKIIPTNHTHLPVHRQIYTERETHKYTFSKCVHICTHIHVDTHIWRSHAHTCYQDAMMSSNSFLLGSLLWETCIQLYGWELWLDCVSIGNRSQTGLYPGDFGGKSLNLTPSKFCLQVSWSLKDRKAAIPEFDLKMAN